MIVRTKKYQLATGKYVGLALTGVLKQQWWVFLIYFVICSGFFFIPNAWWIIGASIVLVLYLLFWLVQFAGVTQLEQSKFLFNKLSYELSSQQILVKLNAKQGMPMKWDQIKRGSSKKEAFILFVSKAQLIYLPHRIFNSDNEVKFFETILKRKGYIK
ncbi:MAG: hypothetical protein CMB82_08855 [Flammeovirgaceae bacterium]|nr:hypothetical protein [Flammeovirgaceae bacterium]